MEKTPLLDLMSAQIAAQRNEVLQAARDEAVAIRQNAQERAEQRRKDSLAAAESELASIARRSRERVEAEAHMVTLTTKDSITNEVLGEVAAELAAIAAGPTFPAILDALLAELMAEAPSDVVVLAPPAHVDHCRRWLESNGRPGLPVEPLCFGQGKLARAEALAQALGADLSRAIFYSDSITDLPLLERVGEAVAVNPDKKLLREARARGWRVEKWY